jgi:hypothetical protein
VPETGSGKEIRRDNVEDILLFDAVIGDRSNEKGPRAVDNPEQIEHTNTTLKRL